MTLSKMSLKTLKSLIEIQYTYCALSSISYEQLTNEAQKNMMSQAGSLAGEQLDILLSEFKKRKGDEKAEYLINSIHDKLNNTTSQAQPKVEANEA
jgi:thermostable 8-oxoguanine DNA glycosylase